MTDQRSGMDADLPAASNEDDYRRELELELIKVRAEAEAARLEARAAELELVIRRMSRAPAAAAETTHEVDSAHVNAGLTKTELMALPTGVEGTNVIPVTPAANDDGSHDQTFSSGHPKAVAPHASTIAARRESVSANPTAHVSGATSFSSWDAVRSAPATCSSPPAESVVHRLIENGGDTTEQINRGFIRPDPPESKVRRPVIADIDDPAAQTPVGGNVDLDDQVSIALDASESGEIEQPTATPLGFPSPYSQARPDRFGDANEVSAIAADVSVDPDAEAEESQRRRSPAAMLVSTVLHVLILIALAAFSLRDQSPKDQVALAASVSNSNEVSMETFEIETSEPESELNEPTPSETEYELSPLGEMKVTEFSPDAPPMPPSPAAAMLSSAQMSAASMALTSDSDAKIQFCGVEGGGNHFVYLVDSSGSMGSAFESARAELLKSIDILKPEQRFYVVFFDAESDYMRLSDPNRDESRSVQATEENKQALKRWAMRITKDRGRAPYDPLKFALELRPDVIFLLSDGEFPQGIEDLLKDTNRVENLFGDSDPISIVHTIGYHSREGESRMKRIAQQNQGRYRHVPKP